MGSINDIHMTSTFSITHILFVDDLVLFGHGTLEEWSNFRRNWFIVASCMVISVENVFFSY